MSFKMTVIVSWARSGVSFCPASRVAWTHATVVACRSEMVCSANYVNYTCGVMLLLIVISSVSVFRLSEYEFNLSE